MSIIGKLFGWMIKDHDAINPFHYVPCPSGDDEEEFWIRFENDDVTPMEYVVKVFMLFLELDRDAAISMMLKIHKEGQYTFGPYKKSYAIQLCDHILSESSKRKLPFYCEAVEAKQEDRLVR